MIEKFASSGRTGPSEFLDLNHTSKAMMLVSHLIPKFAHLNAGVPSELRNQMGH